MLSRASADAMHQFAGAPAGLVIRLKSVGSHEVNSCGSDFFCFATRESMFSKLRILHVQGGGLSGDRPTIPSRNRPQATLMDCKASWREIYISLPKVQCQMNKIQSEVNFDICSTTEVRKFCDQFYSKLNR